MNTSAARFDQINWTEWRPAQRATLLFVIRDGRALLIHKKRGLGAGKINAPGGRIEPGETPEQCAIREIREEVCVTPDGVTPEGQLMFEFVDGFSIHGYVFRAAGCTGEPRETDEAVPHWIALENIPYEKMWADDHVWLPLMLAGRKFIGKFLFDGDTMLGCDVESSSHWKESWPDFSNHWNSPNP